MKRLRPWIAAALLGCSAFSSAAPPNPRSGLVAEGAYLARIGNCQGCHTAQGGIPYAGGRGIPTPFGTVFAPNLTPDADTGLGRWSADDFWRALHHGRSRDGRLLSPAFPYDSYTLVSRPDADAIFSYLRSLPPARSAPRPHELRFPYNTQAALWVWRTLFFRPAEFLPSASQDSSWNRGAYLTQGLAHCGACHGARNALGARRDPSDFSGMMLRGLGWYAPSLHDRAQAGVAEWPQAQLEQWLRTGSAATGSAMGPMAEVVLGSTQHLKEADLQAMARYLRMLPQQRGARSEPEPPKPDTLALRTLGERAYGTHCASCHGQDGEGRAGAYPALRGNRTVLMEPATNLLRSMLHGGFAPATPGHPRPFGMPPFASLLDERELAAIASHVRHAWGNQASDVAPLEVLRLKASR